jgi:hypothetical protein
MTWASRTTGPLGTSAGRRPRSSSVHLPTEDFLARPANGPTGEVVAMSGIEMVQSMLSRVLTLALGGAVARPDTLSGASHA